MAWKPSIRVLCRPASTGLGSGHVCTDHWLPLNCISQPQVLRSCTPAIKSAECISNVPNLSHFHAFAFGCSLRCSVPKSSWERLNIYCNSGFSLKVTSLGRLLWPPIESKDTSQQPTSLFPSEEVRQLLHHYSHVYTNLVSAHLSTTSPKTQKSWNKGALR